MVIKNLISSRLFGELIRSEEPGLKVKSEYLIFYERLRNNFDDFLIQKLELWMFIPCDLKGNILEEPEPPKNHNPLCPKLRDIMILEKKIIEHQEAKKRILFEGFYYKSNTGKDGVKWEYITNGVHYFSFKQINDNTIESLLVCYKGKFEIELTQTAQKQIGI